MVAWLSGHAVVSLKAVLVDLNLTTMQIYVLHCKGKTVSMLWLCVRWPELYASLCPWQHKHCLDVAVFILLSARRNSDRFLTIQLSTSKKTLHQCFTNSKLNGKKNSDEESTIVHGILFCCCVTDSRLVSSTPSKALNQSSKSD